jgi:hypothetical protein
MTYLRMTLFAFALAAFAAPDASAQKARRR